MDDQNIDPKVIAKIKKMLALATHGTATEGEANNAAEMAQRIMLENNISMAQIDGHSSEPEGSKRTKSRDDGNAKYAFQRELMVACAAVNFVYQEVRYDHKGVYPKAVGYTLIGREANVVACKMLFEYLFNTIDRLGLDYVGGDERLQYGIPANSFKEGCSARLAERLRERHRNALAEQARKAREANVAARHPSNAGTALVVVMDDYAQDELDHNEDLRLNRPEGATAHKRLMTTRATKIDNALTEAFTPLRKTVGDREVLRQASRAAFDALCSNRGWTVDTELESIFDRVVQRAISYHLDIYNEAVRYAKLTPLQRQREQEKDQRESDRYWRRYYSDNSRGSGRTAPSAVDRAAYEAGSSAGNKVGLDAQVGAETRKNLK